MDNENKKVNSADKSKAKRPQPIDDAVIDGFFNLDSLYGEGQSKPKLTREEELRIKSEKRRRLEMQAIKEDIERRYSLQVKDASSSEQNEAPKPLSNIMPQIDEREAVRDELTRIDEIINSEAVVSVPIDPEEPQKTEPAPEEAFDPSEANAFYAFFYAFGESIYNVSAKILGMIFKIIKMPFLRLHRLISKATEKTKAEANKHFKATIKEIAYFHAEIKRAGKAIRQAMRSPLSLPSVIIHYAKKAVLRHRNLLKTAANTALPILSLLIFIFTINYWNSVTFALEVIYNDQSIGYISDEAVYIEARDLVKDRLSSGAYASNMVKNNIEATVAAAPAANLNARYSLSLVSLDEINDAHAISDKMIENSVDNLTHACGIYIDGQFICAVKNEADAKTVFYDILAPYEEEAKEKGYVVGFAETIDYIQGLYRDDETVMWDAAKLSLALTEGEDKLVRIKRTISTSSVRDIEFDTVQKRDATKYSGYRKVVQKGVDGSERVTKTEVYIDGILMDTEYSYETIKEAVDEIVTVGTKTSYNGVYIGSASSSGFLWPAPSCHYVSSPYGWRSSGWHNGIDLTKSGGGASGTPVIASKSGRVEVVQRSNSGYGNMVLINHGDGYKTRYAHMIKGSITVLVGETVEAGKTIGRVGSTGNSTGPHLHFEVIYNGETQNPRNYIS